MGLETGSYIADLVASNPVSGDAQSQGDDHIRLLKTVLQATLPNASKAFRFPTDGAAVAGNQTVTFPDDQNKVYRIDATAAARTVTLPTPSGVNAPGWQVTVTKVDSSTNTVTISTGTINGAASYVLRRQYESVTLIWINASSVWIALPHRSTEFAALTAMLFVQTSAPTGWTKDTTTHNNKALRVTTGVAGSGGTVDFTTAFASQSVTGTVGGTALTEAQIPNHYHFLFANDATAPGGISADTYANHTYNGGGDTTSYAIKGDSTLPTLGRSSSVGSGSTHDHSFTGTAINLAVKYIDVILATKD